MPFLGAPPRAMAARSILYPVERTQTGASTVHFSDATVFVWKVRGVQACGMLSNLGGFPPGFSVRSPPFSLGGCSAWYLLLYPGGDAQQAAEIAAAEERLAWRAAEDAAAADREPAPSVPERAMTLLVCCGAHDVDADVRGELSVLGNDGKCVNEYREENIFFEEYEDDDIERNLGFNDLPFTTRASKTGAAPAAVEDTALQCSRRSVRRSLMPSPDCSGA